MKNKKAFAVIIFMICSGIFMQEACKKPNDPDPVPEPPFPGSPELPAVPFDYVSSAAAMPQYIKDFIQTRGLDNTPPDNSLTNDGATLGRVLFYDKQLSVNNTIACASCHHQEKAFTDPVARSKGFNGGLTRRNSMPITNLRFFKDKSMFWDLRAQDLETQALIPIQDMIEMGMPSLGALEDRIKSLPYYPPLFYKAFGTPDISSAKISKALSQFLRSVTSFNSKYDQGLSNNFANFTPEEKAGMQKMKAANCIECHSDLTTIPAGAFPSYLIVDNIGINTGVGSNNGLDENYTDNGIGELTGLAKDMGTFKIPALRNVELTAPYMHDGRFATLEEVITHYQTGVKNNPNRGIQIPSNGYGSFITPQDKANLIAFLKTLTDQSLLRDEKFSNPFK